MSELGGLLSDHSQRQGSIEWTRVPVYRYRYGSAERRAGSSIRSFPEPTNMLKRQVAYCGMQIADCRLQICVRLGVEPDACLKEKKQKKNVDSPSPVTTHHYHMQCDDHETAQPPGGRSKRSPGWDGFLHCPTWDPPPPSIPAPIRVEAPPAKPWRFSADHRTLGGKASRKSSGVTCAVAVFVRGR